MDKYKYRLCVIVVLCATLIIGMVAWVDVTENQAQDTSIECGSCGAHVMEWWTVENINDGEPVEVCKFCYSNYMENMNGSNTTETEN